MLFSRLFPLKAVRHFPSPLFGGGKGKAPTQIRPGRKLETRLEGSKRLTRKEDWHLSPLGCFSRFRNS